MAELKENPTPEEIEQAAAEGWYPSHGGKVWSRYEPGCVHILDLRLFEHLAAAPHKTPELTPEEREVFETVRDKFNGTITTYPYGDENNRNLYRTCDGLRVKGLMIGSRLAGEKRVVFSLVYDVSTISDVTRRSSQ